MTTSNCESWAKEVGVALSVVENPRDIAWPNSIHPLLKFCNLVSASLKKRESLSPCISRLTTAYTIRNRAWPRLLSLRLRLLWDVPYSPAGAAYGMRLRPSTKNASCWEVSKTPDSWVRMSDRNLAKI